jgi:peptidoglycan/LPS O-acetylase OafA/YrhL
MPKSLSIYLDLVRLAAAVLVYLQHSNLISDPRVFLGAYGHSAVVVFFVLSGYVIAFVTDTKEREWTSYAASRWSRVYSVVVPAILLTLVADAIGRAHNPALYPYPWDQFTIRTLASLALMTEVWFVAITPFSNVPFWSISYEGWFYIMFGAATFAPGHWRWTLPTLMLLALGPKIAVMFPMWLAGVALYRWQGLRLRSESAGWLLIVVSWIGIVGLHQTEFFHWTYNLTRAWLGEWLFVQMNFSKFALGDYVLTAFIVANFVGMRAVAHRFDRVLLPIERPVASVASVTFTLYLMHHPLLLCWSAVLGTQRDSWVHWWTVTGLVALSVALIAQVTEKRRGPLRKGALKLLQRLRPAVPRPGEASP